MADKRVGFTVRSHGGRTLELLVWPESGLDNYVLTATTEPEVEAARTKFRRIVGLYLAGHRPPF